MNILDPGLVAELTAATTATMQAIKSHPRIKGSQIPYLSGIVGAGLGVGWYLVGGDLNAPNAFWGIDWQDTFRGLCNGIAGAVSANGAYNLQKILPVPNLLPTAGELDEHKLKEELSSKARNEAAIAEGVEKPAPASPPPAQTVPAAEPSQEATVG